MTCRARTADVRRRQCGAALITAILVVAVATIIGTSIYYDNFLYIKRSENLLLNDQARLYALGAEDWAADILRRDLGEAGERDHLAEEWAVNLPPLPIDGGVLEGRLEDLQGRFNVNNLITVNGERNEAAYEQFRRLLELLGIPQEYADRLLDWLDADQEAVFPDGAEDSLYTGRAVPYRTANGPVTTVSELLALEGMTREMYTALQPYITALPVGTTVNINTASAPVIFAMVPELSEIDAQSIVENRPASGFETMEEFLDLAENADPLELSLNSSYFRMLVRVTIGTHQMSMYSLLTRDAGTVRPLLRSYGSE